MGDRAELRETSTFTYRDAKGNAKEGQVIDVWLSGGK